MGKPKRPLPQVLTPELPVCSRCCKAVPAVVAFLAFSSRNGQAVRHRGASRSVRICYDCSKDIAAAFVRSR